MAPLPHQRYTDNTGQLKCIMRNHVMIYQLHWDNSPQQVTEEVAELYQTVLMSASKCPFV